MMEDIRFDFRDLDDIRPGLLECAVGSHGAGIAEAHLDRVRELGFMLNATAHARNNAERLASGYEDLLVVLLEPSDKAEHVPYDSMFAQSTALQCLDESLRLAFRGQRCVENTMILDIRPFRSKKIRGQNQDGERSREDGKAYEGFREIVSLLPYKVLIVCQCDPCGEWQDLMNDFTSSLQASGEISVCTRNGQRSIRVASFHPMYFERTDQHAEPLKRVMREYLFDATFIVAANVLAGRRVSGFGLENLRSCALNGAVLRNDGSGIRVSLEWANEEDVAGEDVIQRLEALGLASEVILRPSS